MSSGFNESLFDCCDQMQVFWIVCLCPISATCVQAKAVNKAIGQGFFGHFCLVCCLGAIGAAFNRQKIRNKYMIGGNLVSDCCTWCWCGPCAACQEFREVAKRP